jgi:hypothetical protein
MSRVTPQQSSFNGGEISRRLFARIDQTLHSIACAEMTGFAPLVEGPAEAMPGFIHVQQAPGPTKLFRFEYSATQGHVVEASADQFRVYTNDALIVDGGGAPVVVASPYDWSELQQLKTHQSYDVLYCFNPGIAPQEFSRTAPTAFEFNPLEMTGGPFDPRNKNETLRVSASAFSGTITLTATAPLFVATDVGSLFQIEAEDFGDTPAWEPGITVTTGALRTSAERVYRCISGGRTGGLQPIHTEGVEWDGMGTGTDINDKAAPGVQWEYLHDKYGICRITAFTNSQTVTAAVTRRLPFSSVGVYTYTGGYYEAEWGAYTPPGVTYSYGTWRWRFGAFSDTRGWPTAGCIWNERLCLVKGATVYGSVSGDFNDFHSINELGEVSNDMAFTATISDPNPIVELVSDEKLLLFTAGGCHALGPSSAAEGIGPKNLRVDRQHHAGASTADAVQLDGRTLTIGRCGTRIFETDFDPGRLIEAPLDLTRYARHITAPGVLAVAQQRHPHNHIWALRGDGALVCMNYLPDENVLGAAQRPLADGVLARSMVSITDPAGKFDQVWIAAELDGNWHVLRMAPWREDGESDDTGVMLDMAVEDVADPPRANFSVALLAGRTVDVVADGNYYQMEAAAGTGAFVLPQVVSRIVVGLPYEAALEILAIEAGGDSGPARGKMARIARATLEVIDARGLFFGSPGALQACEQVAGDSEGQAAFAPYTGFHIIERAGDDTRDPRLRVERRAPFQATIAAIGCQIETQGR